MEPVLIDLIKVMVGFLLAATGALGYNRYKSSSDKKIPEHNHDSLYPERSDRTSGSKHIAEETLGRVAKIESALNSEVLKEDTHSLLCRNANLEIKNHMTKEFKAFKEEIIIAINGGIKK